MRRWRRRYTTHNGRHVTIGGEAERSAARQLIVIRVKFSLWILHKHTMNLTKKARQKCTQYK